MQNPNPFSIDYRASSQISFQLQWGISFDLHVLGMPPALILSQDQTLNKKIKFIFKLISFSPNYETHSFYLVFKDHFLLFFLLCSYNIANYIFKVNNFFNFFKKNCQILVFYVIYRQKSFFVKLFVL